MYSENTTPSKEIPMSNNVVLYHANCQDGFASAWAAWKTFGASAEYIPVKYGEEPPHYTGYNIYIVDFSYSKEHLLEMGKNNLVQVIDHHKTAKEDLTGFPSGHHNLNWNNQDHGVFANFDMDHSGAVLTWKFFNPEVTEVPLILQMVEDRDLWRFKFPRTNHLNAYLASLPKLTFEEYDRLDNSPADMDAALDMGAAIRRHIDSQVEYACKLAIGPMKDVDDFTAIAVNAMTYQSDIGNALLSKYPEADYADVYYMAVDEGGLFMQHSLRSRFGGADVSAIAKKHGGGGHATAAGYRSHT